MSGSVTQSPVELPTDLTAFVLTQHYHQGRDGIELQFWLASEQGPIQYRVTGQEMVCFARAADLDSIQQLLADLKRWRFAEVALQNLEREPVIALYFQDIQQQREAVKRIEQANLALYEQDIRPPERFLMERFINGSLCFPAPQSAQASRTAQGYLHFTDRSVQSAEYDPQLRVLSLDIETSFYGNELYSIGFYGRDYRSGEDFQWVLMRCDSPESETGLQDWVEPCRNEHQLLRRMVALINSYDPDMIVGWNVINFDLYFLQRKAEQLGVKLAIGRNRSRLHLREGGSNLSFASVPGRAVVDGIDCIRGATYHFESYSLENVAQQLLGRGKKIHDVDNRAAEITHLFRQQKADLAAYNLEDCRLVLDIFDAAGLLNYLIARAHMTGLPLDKVGGSAAAFDNLYLPRLHRQGYVAPVYASGQSGLDSPGGYVMDSRPGLYEHVLVLDFKSLYPSIMCTFKIDPMGLTEGLAAPASEQIPGFNQASFHREKHILPGLLQSLWQQRDLAKAANNSAQSQAIKIIMNAFYGVLGSYLCRFFDQRLSGSITLRGHQIMTESRDFIEQRGLRVIYGDTDSLFVWVEQAASAEQADLLGHELATALNAWWQQRLRDELGIDSFLELEYETHYSRFLMPTIRGSEKGSKKRYAGLVETDGDSKLVFKGLESVRSDWTPLARQFQQELYRQVFAGEDYVPYIRQQVERLLAGELDDLLVYRKRLRQPLSAYIKSQPPHVQAARKSLEARQQQGKPALYERGSAVPYVITAQGAEPVDALHSRIDYEHYLERQLTPVADGVLVFLGRSMEEVLGRQQQLF